MGRRKIMSSLIQPTQSAVNTVREQTFEMSTRDYGKILQVKEVIYNKSPLVDHDIRLSIFNWNIFKSVHLFAKKKKKKALSKKICILTKAMVTGFCL